MSRDDILSTLIRMSEQLDTDGKLCFVGIIVMEGDGYAAGSSFHKEPCIVTETMRGKLWPGMISSVKRELGADGDGHPIDMSKPLPS